MTGKAGCSPATIPSNSADRAHRSELISTFSAQPEMVELVSQYVGEMPGRIRDIRRAWQTADLVTFRRLVHQLKGTAGGYGFMPISRAAARLEASLDESEHRSMIEHGLEQLLALCEMAQATRTRK